MIERLVRRALLLSRWMLAPIYLGLALLMLLVFAGFARELWLLAVGFEATDSTHLILASLTMIDLGLVATLILMVVLSGFENYVVGVQNHDRTADEPEALRRFDPGGLKLKLSAAIVAISSIHLLKSFMRIDEIDPAILPWMIAMHLTFVATTVLLALTERLKAGTDA